MKGKLGLFVGLAAGYVLGTRAGRERYEQISAVASKLWNTAPVQKQVKKAKSFAKSSALALPGAIWDTGVKVVKAASGKATAGEKLDAAVAETKKQAPKVAKAAEKSAEAIGDAVEDVVDKVTDSRSASTRRTPAKRNTTTKKS